jgi:hypothetical protein
LIDEAEARETRGRRMIDNPADLLVGLIALVLVALIGRRIARGMRDGRLPLYRSAIHRADGSAKFNALLVLHALSLLLVALVAADLLLGLGLRERLQETRHAGLDPASTFLLRMADKRRWTPDQVRGDEKGSVPCSSAA